MSTSFKGSPILTALISFDRMVRPLSLLGVLLVLCSVRYGIVTPSLADYGIADPLSSWNFACIVIATLLVTLSSGIINDYFDRRADRHLKPGGPFSEGRVPRRWAMVAHWIISFLAFCIALVPSISVGNIWLALIFAAASGLLWFYSSIYKHRFLLGNVLIAFLGFSLPMLLLIFEVQVINERYWRMVALYRLSITGLWHYALYYSLFISGFVFLYSLSKDVYSFISGIALDSDTIPARYGLRTGKLVVSILFALSIFVTLGTALLLLFTGWNEGRPFFSLIYSSLAIVLPSLIAWILLMLAEGRSQARWALLFLRLAIFSIVIFPLIRLFLLL